MNNIINIRLGHYVLAVDEDASKVLLNYTEALKKRYRNEQGAAEIVQDVEERIGELLQARQQSNARQFTTMEDVREVLAQMGPVDESNAETNHQNPYAFYNEPPLRKRLFRDPDNRIIGGVWSGVANYFDLDPLWLRLAGVVLFFMFGIGLPLYIILWVIVPEAKTTAEKLMMKGQRPNLQNMEQNLKEEFRKVEDRFQSRSGQDQIGNFVRNLVELFVKFLGWVMKVVFLFVGALLVFVLIALLVAFTTNGIHLENRNIGIFGQEGLNACLSAAGDPWLMKIAVVVFLLLSIALVAIRVLVPKRNMESVRIARRSLRITLLVLMLFLLYTAITGALSLSHKAVRNGPSESFNIKGDTLMLESVGTRFGDDGMFLGNYIENYEVSDDSNFHIVQKNVALGFTTSQAMEKARKLPVAYRREGNSLLIEECRQVKNLNAGNAGWSRFTLSVPKGKYIKTGKRFFNGNRYPNWYESGEVLMMDTSGILLGNNQSRATLSLPAHLSELEFEGRYEVQLVQSAENRIELISGPILNHRDWIDIGANSVNFDYDDDFDNDRVSVVRIYTKNLDNINLSGLVELWMRNWKSNSLEVNLNGNAHLRGNMSVNFLKLHMDGISEADMQGKTERLELDMQGASHYRGETFASKKADVRTEGVSTANIWATEALDAECNGASKIGVKGRPVSSNINTHGVSKYEVIN